MPDQIGINETRVRTALALCTNTHFFALKFSVRKSKTGSMAFASNCPHTEHCGLWTAKTTLGYLTYAEAKHVSKRKKNPTKRQSQKDNKRRTKQEEQVLNQLPVPTLNPRRREEK